MQLVLNEDQEMIAQHRAATSSRRTRRSRASARSATSGAETPLLEVAVWKEMADLGWTGIPFAESLGGAELGMAEMAVVLEALGRNLAPEPFLSSILLGGQALAQAGDDAQQQKWLPGVISGDTILTLATQEPGNRFDLCRLATTAKADGDGFVISGEKIQVLDGHAADAIVVPARTSGTGNDPAGITLFLVPKDAAGLSTERQTRLDHRGAAIVRLDGVKVGPDAVLGAVDGGGGVLERVVDVATIGLCAEMLGGMLEAFEQTVQYMKDRQQFGVPIGSFQALKHRAADGFVDVELAKSVVMAAARAYDEGSDELPKLVSLAKATLSDAYVRVANEGVQIFGGVGMTDEYDIGFYLKRARAAELSFGDAAHHRARWAALSGY